MIRNNFLTAIKLWVFVQVILSFDVLASEAEDFFAGPKVVIAALSPKGDYVVSIVNNEDKQELILHTPINAGKKLLLNPKEYFDEESYIRDVQWIDNSHVGVQLSQLKDGIEDLLDTKLTGRLLIININTNEVKSVRTHGTLVDPLPHQDGVFLYAKSGIYSKIYKLSVSKLLADKKKISKLDKVDGGQFKKSKEVISIEGYAIHWYLDQQSEAKASLRYNKKAQLELVQIIKGEQASVLHTWTDAKNVKNQKKLFPVAMASNSSSFYCLDAEDKRTIYEVDFGSDIQKEIYKTHAYKIIDIIQSQGGELVGVKVLKNGAVEYEYLTIGDHQQVATNEINLLVGVNKVGNISLRYLERHDLPGRYVYQVDGQNDIVVGEVYPKLANKMQSEQLEGTVRVDDFEIPYLLTLPNSPVPAPLIVMPHGGPFGVFDDRYFDPVTQFFAANNYAVLRVNFRGSGGYSEALKEAGKKEWGGKMLDDILAVAETFLSNPKINQDRICSVGFSYGGYAATMLVIKRPDIFRCGVNVAGVSDVNLYALNSRLTEGQLSWAKEYVGDSTIEYDRLKSISPVFLVPKITRPLFIAHGKKDGVVDIEHASRLTKMMDKYDKTYDLYIDEDSGHNFSDSEKTLILFNKIIEFLERSI